MTNLDSRVFSGNTSLNIIKEPLRYSKNRDRYEIIYDSNSKTISIKYEDGVVHTCIIGLKYPFYPFASAGFEDDKLTLLKYWVS